MRQRALAAISMAACLATAVPATANSHVDAHVRGAELRATTIISATKSGVLSATLRHSSRITLPYLFNPRKPEDTWVKGRGRIFGFNITLPTQGTRGPQLAEFGMNAFGIYGCYTSGCRPKSVRPSLYAPPLPVQFGNPGRDTFRFEGFHPDGTRVFTLPPGRYLIYVVADGGPVEITLRLPGATPGVSRLSPEEPSSAGVISTPSAGSLPNSYSAGATHSLDGGGFLVSTRTLEFASYTPVVTADGRCAYISTGKHAEDPEPPRGRYLPQCPGGSPGVEDASVVAPGLGPAVFMYFDVWFVDKPAGTHVLYNVGEYTYGADVQTFSSPVNTLWLPLDH
jgi:hypothetical protein